MERAYIGRCCKTEDRILSYLRIVPARAGGSSRRLPEFVLINWVRKLVKNKSVI